MKRNINYELANQVNVDVFLDSFVQWIATPSQAYFTKLWPSRRGHKNRQKLVGSFDRMDYRVLDILILFHL